MYQKVAIRWLVWMGLLGLTAVAHSASQPSSDNFSYLPLIAHHAPPQIVYFAADVTVANPGETITLRWETRQATAVTLYHLLPTHQLGQFWDVAPSGTMSYTIPASSRNAERFYLVADSDTFPHVDSTLTISLNCPYDWFFASAPAICAQDAAIMSAGAEQRFEHGVMLWVAGEARIYVLYDDAQFSPRWEPFADGWQDGDPVDDPSIVPPAGFFQPQRGFGLVWREQPQVRQRLGWALAAEQGYETAVQRTSYPKYNEVYIRAADGHIWRLLAERSGWEKIAP